MGAAAPPNQAASGLRVLLVEDESLVAMLLEDMLTELGHQVVGPVSRIGKALELARSEQLEAAILDVNLNGLEVYPVAAVLAARGIPFVFATGYGKRSLPAPYDSRPTLSKPFQQQDVRAVLAEMRQAKPAAASADDTSGTSPGAADAGRLAKA
jgi:CheY-like chemotaxis protein